MRQPTIKTKNFILRPFRKNDAFQVAEQASDKEVYKNTLVLPYPYHVSDAKKWLGKVLKERQKKYPKSLPFAIVIDDKVAGSISLEQIKHGHKAETGYWLGKDFRGRKIMTQAVKEICKFGFNDLELKRITAKVFLFNPTSKRVLEKNNFKLEGILKKESKKGNRYIDTYLFAKIK